MKQPQAPVAQLRGESPAVSFWIKDQVNPMLLRRYNVSTRFFLQLLAAAIFIMTAAGVASAANQGNAPLLVPYTVQTVAGTPQYTANNSTALTTGYGGDAGPAVPYLSGGTVVSGATLSSTAYGVAVDSVGNVYFTDTGNDIIREVNAQTGIINTVAGESPKGCSGTTCSNKFTGCSDGVPALGNPIGGHLSGIALDAYGNVYFADNTLDAVWVVYRGGSQVANFISLVDNTTVPSASKVQVGYVYHIGGALSSCTGNPGTTDNVLSTQAQLRTPQMISLDSAGNIYIADTGNSTTRVINTQATAQTFFQYSVQPGFMRSIVNCNAALTTTCPAVTTTIAGTGINGPANGLVFNPAVEGSETDQYGNVYEFNTKGAGNPGIYTAAAYAGGAPLTSLLTVESNVLNAYYGPGNSACSGGPSAGCSASELPLTYGDAYIVLGNPASSNSTLLGSPYTAQPTATNGAFDVRPSDLTVDIFGTLWYMDNHYPYIERVDQYTESATYLIGNNRATASVTFSPEVVSSVTPSVTYASPATLTNQWFCVYGGGSSPGYPWTQGPRSPDPEGDNCPAIIANIGTHGTSSSIYTLRTDGLGQIYMSDAPNPLIREVQTDTIFPATPLASSANPAPVTQGIQLHFDKSNPPYTGAAATVGTNIVTSGTNPANNTATFQIIGSTDFSVDTTTPEFALGSLGLGGYSLNQTSSNWAMWSGLPTCYQFAISLGDPSYDCLVYVKFNPTGPGLRTAQLLVTTANGSQYSFSLSGVGQGGQLSIDGGQQQTFASTGLGTTAGIAVSSTGLVYIADPSNNRIVSCPVGTVPCASPTPLALGTPASSSTTPTTLNGPMGVAADGAGNVYIADTGNNRIVKVNTAAGTWSVIGNNVWISNGAAPGSTVPQYQFKAPQGVAVDQLGNVYVADTGNAAIVEIPANTALGGAVQLFQYPNAPTFVSPVALAVDANGFIYVADTGNAAGNILRIPPGGGDLQPTSNNQYSALFTSLPAFSGESITSPVNVPNGVAVDGAKNVYVSDSSNNTVWVVPATSGAGGVAPYQLNFTGLNGPAGLALDASGNLYVADSGNKQVLFSNRQNPMVNFGTVPQNTGQAEPICANTTLSDGLNTQGSSTGCVLTVTNTGTQTVTLTSPVTTVTGVTPSGDTAFAVTNTCGTTLPAGATCIISPTFQPTSDGAQSENLDINGGTNSVALVASTNAVGAQPLANIVLTSSAGTSPAANSTPTITATVTQPHITGNTPSGTVTFTYSIDAGSYQSKSCGTGGSATVSLSGGVAQFVLPAVGQGLQYTVSANYNGDSQNSPTQATPLVLSVPGITESYVANSVSYTYGQPVPAISGTMTPAPPSGLQVKFLPGGVYNTAIPGASPTSDVANSPYPIEVQFTGTNACAYGFPTVLTSSGAPAVVTENPAPLTMTVPAFTTVYGAPAANFFSTNEISGAVGNDLLKLSATFTPADTSVLDVNPTPPAVNPYPVVATLTGKPIAAGDYTVKYVNGTDTVTAAPAGTTVTQSATSVLTGSANTVSFSLLTSTLVTEGKGIPTGTITVTDNFVPIDTKTFGPACNANLTQFCNNSVTIPACSTSVTTNCIPPCSTTVTTNCSPLPLTAGSASFTLPSTFTELGTHNFTFTYSGDAGSNGDGKADFQCSVVGGAATSSCPTTSTTAFSLVEDYKDINLSSATGPLIIVPGTTPSGLGLPAAPGQNSSYPETAAIQINPILGFTGTVSMSCTTQNPSYVSCSMTPPSVCFGSTSPCIASGSATAILSVSTPATLPLGFFGNSSTAQVHTAAGKTALAFLPLGVLAFCFRKRKRLSQVLLALMVLGGMTAGMSGCGGGNQVNFYTPVPTGAQTVTVTATYTSTNTPLFCGTASSCTVTRSFVVPINID